jgi:hypothetical protein
MATPGLLAVELRKMNASAEPAIRRIPLADVPLTVCPASRASFTCPYIDTIVSTPAQQKRKPEIVERKGMQAAITAVVDCRRRTQRQAGRCA